MLRRTFHILIALFCAAWLIKEIMLPVAAAGIYSRSYMKHTVACDIAMESAWYGDQENITERNAQDIHLLDCHEYDKTRKIMLMAGLPEVYLSWLGLQALEIYQRPASELSEAHRFKER